MLPRRPRMSRLYRRLTRRQPNRKAQWTEISGLRHAGSVGYPKPRASEPVVLTPDEEPQPQIPLVEDWVEPAPWADEQPKSSQRAGNAGLLRQKSTNAAIVSLMLLFLGCAYAAFAGFVQFHSMTLARWGCWGALICIAVAGAGIRLSTIPRWHVWGARFAAVSILSLGTLFVLLVSKGLGA